jgi:hypothetical protein
MKCYEARLKSSKLNIDPGIGVFENYFGRYLRLGKSTIIPLHTECSPKVENSRVLSASPVAFITNGENHIGLAVEQTGESGRHLVRIVVSSEMLDGTKLVAQNEQAKVIAGEVITEQHGGQYDCLVVFDEGGAVRFREDKVLILLNQELKLLSIAEYAQKELFEFDLDKAEFF